MYIWRSFTQGKSWLIPEVSDINWLDEIEPMLQAIVLALVIHLRRGVLLLGPQTYVLIVALWNTSLYFVRGHWETSVNGLKHSVQYWFVSVFYYCVLGRAISRVTQSILINLQWIQTYVQ